MSVVNRMLQDLAARRGAPAEVDRSVPEPPALVDTGRGRTWLALAAIAALCAAAGTGVLCNLGQTPSGSEGLGAEVPLAAPPLATPEPAPPVQAAEAAPSSGATLRWISVNHDADHHEIQLSLSAPVEHSVTTPAARRLVVRLADTRPLADLAGVDLTRTALESLHVVAAGRATEVHVELARAARPTSTMYALGDEALLEVRVPLGDERGDTRAGASRARAESPHATPADGDRATAPQRPAHGPDRAAQSAPRFSKRIPAPQTSPAARAYERGVGLLSQGHAADAEQALHEALSLDPRYAPARVAAIAALLAQGKIDPAVALAEEGRRLLPGDTVYVRRSAQALLQSDAASEALALLEPSPPRLADDPEYHALLAAAYQRAHEPERAVKVYRQVLRHAPDRARSWLGLAVSLEDLARGDEALSAYRSAALLGGLPAEATAFVRERIVALEAGEP